MSAPAGAPFAPGRHAIEAYGGGGFRFAGMRRQGAILATPQGIRAIEAATLNEVTEETLSALFAELQDAPGSIELLILGTGEKLSRPTRALAERIRAAGLRFEPMATGPASRVYNVLLDEGRRVAALLLPAP